MPAYGGVGSGPANAATFDTNTQQFSWNNLGSPRGVYRWAVTASDGQASDEGTITIHKTTVPEPSTVALCGLAMVSLFALLRRR
ncbi:MAG: PEP-CTERM sorting domain-containing protein [Pirellulales bacterium]